MSNYDWFELLREGDLIRSSTGDYHRVLKIEGQGHNQSVNGYWSIQHNGESPSRKRVTIYDGSKFMRTIDVDEMDRQYTEINTHVPMSLIGELKKIDNEFVKIAINLLIDSWPPAK